MEETHREASGSYFPDAASRRTLVMVGVLAIVDPTTNFADPLDVSDAQKTNFCFDCGKKGHDKCGIKREPEKEEKKLSGFSFGGTKCVFNGEKVDPNGNNNHHAYCNYCSDNGHCSATCPDFSGPVSKCPSCIMPVHDSSHKLKEPKMVVPEESLLCNADTTVETSHGWMSRESSITNGSSREYDIGTGRQQNEAEIFGFKPANRTFTTSKQNFLEESQLINSSSNTTQTSYGGYWFDGRCYHCGVEGHISRNCPKRSANERFDSRPNFNRPQCHLCGKLGHISLRCPRNFKIININVVPLEEFYAKSNKSKGNVAGKAGEDESCEFSRSVSGSLQDGKHGNSSDTINLPVENLSLGFSDTGDRGSGFGIQTPPQRPTRFGETMRPGMMDRQSKSDTVDNRKIN